MDIRVKNRASFLVLMSAGLLVCLLVPFIHTAGLLAASGLQSPNESPAVYISPAAEPFANILLDMAPLKLPIAAYVENGTTMVPMRALGEALGASIGWSQSEQAATYSKNNFSVTVQIGQTEIYASGEQTLTLPLPAVLREGNTMVPLRLFSEILGYQVDWDQLTRTVFIRSPKEPIELWGFYALGSTSYSSWKDAFGAPYPAVAQNPLADSMEGAFLGWYAIDKEGRVVCEPNPTGFEKPDGWQAVLLQSRLNELQTFSMYFADEKSSNVSEILDDPYRRDMLAKDIARSAREYDGVLIDFEGLGLDSFSAASVQTSFNKFLTTLKENLEGKALSVAVPPLNSSFLGYDHKFIGELSDFVVLMAYAYEDPAYPTPTAPFDRIDEAVRLETSLVSPKKIMLGIPAYGTIYRIDGDVVAVQARPAAKDSHTIVPFNDSTVHIHKHIFIPEQLCTNAEWETQDGTAYVAFMEDSASLQARLLMTKRYGIKGAAIWRLGLLPDGWRTEP